MYIYIYIYIYMCMYYNYIIMCDMKMSPIHEE